LPANFGRFGILKSEFGRAFARAAAGRARLDISDDPAHVIYGEDWPRFLGASRFTLASEGGSGVLDPTGEVRDGIEAYLASNPSANFDEVAQACLRPEHEAHTFAAISPRVFEAAMAGCCPILIEGDYSGLIAPEEHYIPVRRDLSNLEATVERLQDHEAARQMAERFERAILGNPALRYANWVKSVFDVIAAERSPARRRGTKGWEFDVLAEKHRSAIERAYRDRIDDLTERLRILGNEADAERRRLIASYEAGLASERRNLQTAQQLELDQMRQRFTEEVTTIIHKELEEASRRMGAKVGECKDRPGIRSIVRRLIRGVRRRLPA
jgi:hypothetical protein